MPHTLIQGNPDFKKEIDKSKPHLEIAEMFSDTLQGEGVSTGVPSTFLRVKDCTLDCIWCDSAAVWKQGNPYLFEEIFGLMDAINLPSRLKNGQHLILTGGSPVRAQKSLLAFIEVFQGRYGFKPFIEVENECVLEPTFQFAGIVDQWNNSPKLANSGMKERSRYKPHVIKNMSLLPNSTFKFVISCDEDWEEIQTMFLDTDLIQKNQIIIMPEGQNQEELLRSREMAADIVIKHNVRFSDRLHITIWDKKTGV